MATLRLTNEQARRLRLRGQCLAERLAEGPAAAARAAAAACGLQAQDVFAAALGVRARCKQAALSAVTRSRSEERSVVWTWAMRGTLHLFDAADARWLLPLIGPHFVAAAATRRRQLGIDEDAYIRGLAAIRAALSTHGPSTRESLAPALTAAGVNSNYSTSRHLLYRAALEGHICCGPDLGAKPTFVLLSDWLGMQPWGNGPQGQDREAGLAELATRYLAAYAPATPADMVAWSGLPAPMVGTGWSAVSHDLAEVSVAGRAAWVPRGRLAEMDAPLAENVRLLPAFDTYLLGHRSRDLVLDRDHSMAINGGGGMIRATLLLDGQVIGTWLANRKGRRVNVTLAPFAPLESGVAGGVADEIAAIERFVST